MRSIITLEDNVGLIYTKAAEKVLPSTVTLYISLEKGGDSIESLGSGILVQYEANYFLITAGHCLKQDKKVILSGILDGREFHNLKGVALVEHGLKEKIDVGIVKLSDESIQACLRNHQFIPQSQILNNSIVKQPADYFVAGFPNTKVQIQHRAKKVKKDLAPFLMQSRTPEYYQKLIFHPDESLLLRFDKRRSTIWSSGEISMAPNPEGMSGCGIWYIPDYFVQNLDNITPMLSSIFIEYHPSYRTIVATKFEVITPLLKGLAATKTL
jgi:hypothetical protein